MITFTLAPIGIHYIQCNILSSLNTDIKQSNILSSLNTHIDESRFNDAHHKLAIQLKIIKHFKLMLIITYLSIYIMLY